MENKIILNYGKDGRVYIQGEADTTTGLIEKLQQTLPLYLTEKNKPQQVQISTLKAGERFTFAGVEWVKLDDEDGDCLCLAAECVCNKPFDEDNCNDWRESSLRDWLNDEYFGELEDALLSNIPYPFAKIVSDLTADDGMTDYGTAKDYVTLLSCDQYRKYRGIIPALDDGYWTLTPWTCNTANSGYVCYVYKSGTLCDVKAYRDDVGVRPLCKLKPETLVEPKGNC